jgi:hypothetical protein
MAALAQFDRLIDHFDRTGAKDVRIPVSGDQAQQSPAGIRSLKSIDEHGSGFCQPSRKRACLAGLQGFDETGRGSQDGELRITSGQRRPWNSKKSRNSARL